MTALTDKKIILAVTGSIAAYKAAFLCRLLIKEGAEVKIIMTASAADLIGPLTLATLSKNPVTVGLHDSHSWNNHVELGLWADLLIIAPATANTIAHMAWGLCDSAVDAVYLSAKCPVMFAPAMDLDMWKHPATQKNIETLKSYGTLEIGVGTGELASGLTGPGRMAEPEEILSYVKRYFASAPSHDETLAGKKVLVTAGPTHEKLDPVRFIGNNSSGKMGVAIAAEFAKRGAKVTLILGPGSVTPPDMLNIATITVSSAEDMFQAVAPRFSEMDIVVFAAAVADYRPAIQESQKIKKRDDILNIELVKTIDIAGTLGKKKSKGQTIVGFALETNNEEKNALEKLVRKNMDLIVLNSLNDPGAGFAVDTNQVTIFGTTGILTQTELLSKQEIAVIIVDEIVKLRKSK